MAEPISTSKSSRRGPRHDARVAAAQFGYQVQSQGGGGPEDLAEFWELRPIHPKSKEFAETLIRGVSSSMGQLDERLAGSLENYRLERVNPVELAILRIAVWELFHSPEPPPAAVVINEALEVAHRLGGSDSARFVNGVLDRLAKT